MQLQSDPTVAYARERRRGALDRPLTRADLDRDTPTTPTASAACRRGRSARPASPRCSAVTQPARSDDLYFVADGSGGHAFARTLEEHNRNVARWRSLAPAPTELR